MNELTKSIRAVLYERVKSPLAGSFVIAWLVWNWKIVYATFFVSEKNLNGTRIDYIIAISDKNHLIWWPLISTVFIIAVFPILSHYSYELSLWFRKWNIDRRNIINDKTRLSIEESADLRKELREANEKYAQLLKDNYDQLNSKTEQITTLYSSLEKCNKEKEEIKEIANNLKNTIRELEEKEKREREIKNQKLVILKLKSIIDRSARIKENYINFLHNKPESEPIRHEDLIPEIKKFCSTHDFIIDSGDDFYYISSKGEELFSKIEIEE